jgi:hypothetical protein
MAKTRGKEHTTLTETAQEVVSVLRLQRGVKMIAPGIINQNARGGSGSRVLTIVYWPGSPESSNPYGKRGDKRYNRSPKIIKKTQSIHVQGTGKKSWDLRKMRSRCLEFNLPLVLLKKSDL